MFNPKTGLIRTLPSASAMRKRTLQGIANSASITRPQVIDITPNVARTALGQANQNSALARQVAELTAQVKALANYVVQDAGEVVRPANVAEGYSLYAQPDENGKGGIIWSPAATFAAAAPADTTVEVDITGLDHARLTSCSMRAVQFVLSGDLADLTEAAKITASVKLNGLTHNRFNRVPLDFAPGPGGVIVTTMPIPQGIYVPPDTFVSIEFATVAALTTTSSGTVEARIMAGE